MLQEILIPDFRNAAGTVQKISLTYQVYGPALGTAPVVLVNHALTGNSQVTGKNGWWNRIVGPSKSIDTDISTVISFNIPGNGFDGKKENLIHNYADFTLRDIAKIFLIGLEELNIDRLFAITGGSIGGALAWEIAALKPDLVDYLIPVATDYKATDWVLAQCRVQDQILNNSVAPVHDARLHAMTFYRSPQSFRAKFNRTRSKIRAEYEVQSWLSHHGKKLESRYQLASYKLMNHLLTTIDISGGTGDFLGAAKNIKGNIHIVAVNSDWFFLADENWDTYVDLSLLKKEVSIHEIKSIHGHDAFLIEDRQLANFLRPIFHPENIKNEKNKYRSVRNG